MTLKLPGFLMGVFFLGSYCLEAYLVEGNRSRRKVYLAQGQPKIFIDVNYRRIVVTRCNFSCNL